MLFMEKQHDTSDCGCACLTSILRFYHKKVPLAICRELTKTDSTGSSFYGLSKAAQSLGCDAIGLSGTPQDLLDGLQKKEITLPFIARIITEENMEHFVVFFGISKRKFLIGDPKDGKIHKLNPNEFFSRWQGEILCITPNEKEIEKQFNTPHYIRDLLLQNKTIIGYSFIISIALTIFALASSLVMERIVNHIQAENLDSSFIAIFTVLLLAISAMQVIVNIVRGKVLTKFSSRLEKGITRNTIKNVSRLMYNFFETHRSGDTLSRIQDINSITSSIVTCCVTIVFNAILVLFCGILIFLKSQLLFYVTIGFVVLYAIAVLFFNKPIHEHSKAYLVKKADYNASIKDFIDDISMVKQYSCEQYFGNQIENKLASAVEANQEFTLINFYQNAITSGISTLCIVAILSIGCLLILANKLSFGQLMLVYSLIGYMIGPIGQILSSQSVIAEAKEAKTRLDDIEYGEKESIEDTPESLCIADDYSITISDLSFRYGYREYVLDNINLQVKQGSKVAFTGHSGSGKTTLAKLFLRLYDLEDNSGVIQIGKHNIEAYSLPSIRKNIVYVPQKSLFFRGSLRDNIRLGMDYSDESIYKLLHQHPALQEFVNLFPFKLDTYVDDKGENFSEGQKQKISLIRALIRKPRILILDESTSNIDSPTENRIIDSLFDYCSSIGSTCILITHNQELAAKCDSVIHFANGNAVLQK